MKHYIDPKIDCVFKAVLGAEENRNLLIHFLNSLLGNELISPITEVEILNPYNEKEFLGDKLSIVDIKARDSAQQLYQVEIQIVYYENLLARVIYNWCDIYSEQLKSGKDYLTLKPLYSIWLLAETLINDDDVEYKHRLKFRDDNGKVLFKHGGIYLLELNKFAAKQIGTEEQRWLKFFKDGGQLDDTKLPNWMNTEEMRQAMTTLSRFSEKERHYYRYQARQEYLRQQRTMQLEAEQAQYRAQLALQKEQIATQKAIIAIQEKDTAVQEKDIAVQEKDVAVQEKDIAVQEKDAAIQRLQKVEAALQKAEAAIQREKDVQIEISRLQALPD